MGDAMEVVAPELLRESIKLKCEAMSNLYTPPARRAGSAKLLKRRKR